MDRLELFPVSDIFESIQGEGNWAGVRSLFVRFQFCNLTCIWCDTKHTWFANSGSFSTMSGEKIKTAIRESDVHHVIFTGGEPSLFRLDKLSMPGHRFHVETNGTLIPTMPLELTIRDGTTLRRDRMEESVIAQYNWVISPKLSNAGDQPAMENLPFWVGKPYAVFKFVIRPAKAKKDIEEVTRLVDRLGIEKHRVYVSLEGTTAASQLNTAPVEVIIQQGYNYSPRLQILLWNGERGK